MRVKFIVANIKTKADLILGYPWMKANKIQLDYGDYGNIIDKDNEVIGPGSIRHSVN